MAQQQIFITTVTPPGTPSPGADGATTTCAMLEAPVASKDEPQPQAPEIPQPTSQEVETMLWENNITPVDCAHKTNNTPLPEAFDPYDALVDYEECMRMSCKTSTSVDNRSGSVDEILRLLPETPPGLTWGITPLSAVNYPLLVHHAQEMSSKDIRDMLTTHPYLGGPPRFSPQGRDYAVPGKFLHRLLAIGWITDEEAKRRWLDIDWYSLRDYRAYLARVGNGIGEFVISNTGRKRIVEFDGTTESRERIWKLKKDHVECKRFEMELDVLMSEGRDESAAMAFYGECGAGYVTQPEEDSDVVLEKPGEEGVSTRVTTAVPSGDPCDAFNPARQIQITLDNAVALLGAVVNGLSHKRKAEEATAEGHSTPKRKAEDSGHSTLKRKAEEAAAEGHSMAKRKAEEATAEDLGHSTPKRRKIAIASPPSSPRPSTPRRRPLSRTPGAPLLRSVPLPDVLTPTTSVDRVPAALATPALISPRSPTPLRRSARIRNLSSPGRKAKAEVLHSPRRSKRVVKTKGKGRSSV